LGRGGGRVGEMYLGYLSIAFCPCVLSALLVQHYA
jgi:hypothetical protein